MDRKAVFPIFPDPQNEYSRRWASDLVRALDQMAAIIRNPGEGRNTRITLTDLPTSDNGLEPGAVFRQGNRLYISTLDSAYLAGFSATASLGTVTVTV